METAQTTDDQVNIRLLDILEDFSSGLLHWLPRTPSHTMTTDLPPGTDQGFAARKERGGRLWDVHVYLVGFLANGFAWTMDRLCKTSELPLGKQLAWPGAFGLAYSLVEGRLINFIFQFSRWNLVLVDVREV